MKTKYSKTKLLNIDYFFGKIIKTPDVKYKYNINMNAAESMNYCYKLFSQLKVLLMKSFNTNREINSFVYTSSVGLNEFGFYEF